MSNSAVRVRISSAADIWECERLARQNNCSYGRKRLSSIFLQVFVEMSLSEIWSIIVSVQSYPYEKMMSRKIDVERFVWYVSNIKWTSIKNVHCYIGMVYMLFYDKHSQLVLEVRLYIFAVYKYELKYKSVHSTTASEYVTHTWSIRPPCHFYSSSSPHLLNIYVGHRAAAVLLNIY